MTFPTTDLTVPTMMVTKMLYPVRSRLQTAKAELIECILKYENGPQLIGFTNVYTTITVTDYVGAKPVNIQIQVVDYKIAVARNVDGYIFSIVWGPTVANFTGVPPWNPAYSFTTVAGFRQALTRMRYARYHDVRTTTMGSSHHGHQAKHARQATKLVLVGERPPLKLRLETSNLGA